jgi:hypothetical protein
MGTGYNVNCTGSDNIVQRALDIASGGTNEIEAILKDLQGGSGQGNESILGDSGLGRVTVNYNYGWGSVSFDNVTSITQANGITSITYPWSGGVGTSNINTSNIASIDNPIDTGRDVLNNYNIGGNVDIKTAAGAMVIDDLMQKISTKVQVAAQLLSTANNIAKTASRIMSQG